MATQLIEETMEGSLSRRGRTVEAGAEGEAETEAEIEAEDEVEVGVGVEAEISVHLLTVSAVAWAAYSARTCRSSLVASGRSEVVDAMAEAEGEEAEVEEEAEGTEEAEGIEETEAEEVDEVEEVAEEDEDVGEVETSFVQRVCNTHILYRMYSPYSHLI